MWVGYESGCSGGGAEAHVMGLLMGIVHYRRMFLREGRQMPELHGWSVKNIRCVSIWAG